MENIRAYRTHQTIVYIAIAERLGGLTRHRYDVHAAILFGLTAGAVFNSFLDVLIDGFPDLADPFAPLANEQDRRIIGIFCLLAQHDGDSDSALGPYVHIPENPGYLIIRLVFFSFLPFGLQIIDKGQHGRVFDEFVEVRFFKLRSQLTEIIDIHQEDGLRRNETGRLGQSRGLCKCRREYECEKTGKQEHRSANPLMIRLYGAFHFKTFHLSAISHKKAFQNLVFSQIR